ncbi:MAG: hypothetical protein ACI4L1_01605 [Christensenellales bacterium]
MGAENSFKGTFNINYKDLFKLESHEHYTEDSKEYNVRRRFVNICLDKYKVSSELRSYFPYIFMYEVNGLCKVNWEKIVNIPEINNNVVNNLREAIKNAIVNVEILNPIFSRRIREACGVEYSLAERVKEMGM